MKGMQGSVNVKPAVGGRAGAEPTTHGIERQRTMSESEIQWRKHKRPGTTGGVDVCARNCLREACASHRSATGHEAAAAVAGASCDSAPRGPRTTTPSSRRLLQQVPAHGAEHVVVEGGGDAVAHSLVAAAHRRSGAAAGGIALEWAGD